MNESTLIPVVNSLETGKPEAPKQIKLFPLGLVKSSKGNFLVDSESFNSILNHFKAHQVDIPIDYEHQTLQDVQAPAAGWIKNLTLKSDGVYANVEWTGKAAQYIKEKEYRYLSPVVNVRVSDRKALTLHSVALTNTPAIDGMTAIVNSEKVNPAPVKANNATEEAEPSEKTPPKSSEPETEDPVEFIKGLRDMLQLPEDAPFSDIENQINTLLQSASSLNLEVNSLRFETHKQQADTAVAMALKSGKIMPYQKDWAFRSAMLSPEDFSDWVKGAPQIVPMGEIAFESLTLKETRPLTRAHELMGLSADDVKKFGDKPL